MKKLIILLTVLGLTAFSFQSYSQTNFGIKAGLNVNNINRDFEDSDGFDTKINAGFHIGPTLDIALSDQLGLKTGLMFTSKGFTYDMDDTVGMAEINGYWRFRFNYFEIPMSFALKIDEFQIFAGPYLAIGIGGKSVADFSRDITSEWYSGETEYFDEKFDLKPVFGDYDSADLGDDELAFNALDFGLNFGIGYQVGPMLLNAGYSLGLGNITAVREDRDDYDPADEKMSNRVIAFSASFFF